MCVRVFVAFRGIGNEMIWKSCCWDLGSAYIFVFMLLFGNAPTQMQSILLTTLLLAAGIDIRAQTQRETHIYMCTYIVCIYIKKCVRFCICIISKRLLAVATFRDCHCSSSSVKLSRRFSIWRQKLKLLSYATNYFLLLLL